MRRIILIFLVFTCVIHTGFSQDNDTFRNTWHPSQGALLDGRTILKVNLPGLALGFYGFSAERVIGKHFSLVGNVGYFPSGNIPYASKLSELVKDDEGFLEMAQINSLTSSLEMRFYTGRKGYGRGFYISPYYKYGKSGFDNIKTQYINDEDEEYDISLNGNLKTHSGGILLGCQWLAGKRKNIVIDWSLLGVHVGYLDGNVLGDISPDINSQDQQDVKENIEDILDENLGKINLYKYTVNVSSNNADINIKGPWAFLRMSLSVGIRL